MNYFVYAIKSKTSNQIYVGISKDIERRLKEHNNKEVKSTKAYTPWKLIYKESCEGRKRARKREKYFKSGCGKEFLKNIIA